MKVGIYLNKKYFSDGAPYVDKISRAFGTGCEVVDDLKDIALLEVLFVLGGDGTILDVATVCATYNVKIIGVNYGHMGFLAEFEPNKLDEAIELVKSGKYLTQNRSTLKICCGGKQFYALNDVVLQRGTDGENFSNTVNVHAEIDGSTVDNFSSDGIIVSTPTGSTAYSLSAGGSVLAPDISAFILTPICAHSLHSRPVVFSDDSVLKLCPFEVSAPLIMLADGKPVAKVSNGECVTVTKGENCVTFITKNDKNFFNKLLIKLNIWSK